jgi:hypothetical protein
MGGSEEDLKRRELEAKIAYEDKCVSFEKHRELAQVRYIMVYKYLSSLCIEPEDVSEQ